MLLLTGHLHIGMTRNLGPFSCFCDTKTNAHHEILRNIHIMLMAMLHEMNMEWKRDVDEWVLFLIGNGN